MKRIYEINSNIIRFEAIYKNGKLIDEIIEELSLNKTPIVESLDENQSIITFLYLSEDDCDNVLFLPPVGMDNFDGNQMERILDTNLWYATYIVRNDVRFGYYFSPNDPLDQDWEKRYERLIHDVNNPNFTVFKGNNGKKDTKRSDVILNKADMHIWTQKMELAQEGKLSSFKIRSEHLNEEREISIYTPCGYENFNDELDYILLSDGKEHLDLLSTNTVLDNLIFTEKLPMTIGIFVDSTNNRAEELRCNDKFVSFLIDEVIPWVRNRYNISSNPQNATISGFSLGGLTSAYVGLKYPEVFGKILSQSGSFWYAPEMFNQSEDDCWMSEMFKNTNKYKSVIYMNVGLLETPDRMIDTNENLYKVLQSLDYDVHFEYFKSGHDYLSWGEYLGRGMISLYQRDHLQS